MTWALVLLGRKGLCLFIVLVAYESGIGTIGPARWDKFLG